MVEADFRTYVAEKTGLTKAINKAINLDNQLGTANKPPKLLTMEDYPVWKDRFYNYIMGLDATLWIVIEEEYQAPLDERQITITAIGKTSIPQRQLFEREKKTYNQLYQGMGNEIQHQFKQFKTSRSMWIALKDRFFGNS